MNKTLINLASCGAPEALSASFEGRHELTGGQAEEDVIWEWDIKTGGVWWSDGMLRSYGHPFPAGAGLVDFLQLVHPLDRDAAHKELEETLCCAATERTALYRLLGTNGSPVAVRDRRYVIRDAEGRALRVIGRIADPRLSRQSHLHALQSHWMDTRDHLMGGIVHDFGNLLTVILGNAELLASAQTADPTLQALAHRTANAARRGKGLTERLLGIARKQSGPPESLDLAVLVDDLIGLLRHSWPSRITINVTGDADAAHAAANTSMFEAAMLNLLLNARDAISEGGAITVDIRNYGADAAAMSGVPDLGTTQLVAISVTDTGSGMHKDVLERVAEPFFTTKPAGQGNGLGMSMVHDFVRQSGGYADIHSLPGDGTTVRIWLPRTAVPAQQHEAGPEVKLARARLLVVEDDDFVREYATALLVELGYSVVGASGSDEALDILQSGEVIDLVMTDMVMDGGMSGQHLARRARQLRPDLKMLFTSGYAGTSCLPLAEPFLAKPYNRDDISAKLRYLLE